MKSKHDARRNRRAFAMIEPFIASLILLLIGIGLTASIRYLFRSEHWSTLAPAIIASIPFLFFFGLVLPLCWWQAIIERGEIASPPDQRDDE